MAIAFSQSWSNNLIFSLKISMISIGVLSSAVFMSSYLPAMSELYVFWKSVRSWLTPTYLYFIINGIIIIIVASSRFSQKNVEEEEDHHQTTEIVEPVKMSVDLPQNFSVTLVYKDDFDELNRAAIVVPELDSFLGYESKGPAVVEEVRTEHDVFVGYQVNEPVVVEPEYEAVVDKEVYCDVVVLKPDVEVAELNNSKTGLEEEVDQFNVAGSNLVPPSRTDWMENFKEYSFGDEKPPTSVRFGHQRRVTPEGGMKLNVSNPKRHETLESTWKMITEGRSIPLWETNTPAVPANEIVTFNDHTTTTTTTTTKLNVSNGMLKKEPSLSQEELNRRAEEFIKKFNEEMRLQRLESLKQYQEMIAHGGH